MSDMDAIIAIDEHGHDEIHSPVREGTGDASMEFAKELTGDSISEDEGGKDEYPIKDSEPMSEHYMSTPMQEPASEIEEEEELEEEIEGVNEGEEMESEIEETVEELSYEFTPQSTVAYTVEEPQDIVMEEPTMPQDQHPVHEVPGDAGAASDEAAQLLHTFSTLDPEPVSSVPTIDQLPADETASQPAADPTDISSHEQPQLAPPSYIASSSLAHLESDMPISDSPPVSETPSKPKTKRKRNAVAGPSRRPSHDLSSTGPIDRPPHYLGEDNGIIRCICGIEDDDGFTIQCEGCGAWEHGQCFGYLDETQAPEIYLCELCDPRPFDAVSARERQLREMTIRQGFHSNPENTVTYIEEGTETKTGKPRGKGKRARTGSLMDGEEKEEPLPKDASPARMAPPSAKPKRRGGGPGSRPRAKPTETPSQPSPAPTFKEPHPPSSSTTAPPPDINEDYFRIDPWELEFTPVKDNVVRGIAAKRIMCSFYKEWVVLDEDGRERETILKRSRMIHDESGLPSPTEPGVLRLSPEDLFPPPDFSTLAPPIPPVSLSGPDLHVLASPTSIKTIRDSSCFLPLNYVEQSSISTSTSGIYSRPSIYGIFADEPIPTGGFLGDYRGEVLDSETYRRDPINQYSGLGMPKPYVRSVGPPVNLIIDARGYGCKLRFIRSGCHPNVVLRPLLHRKNENIPPKLRFGIFASRDIGKKEEIILGWEWDDQHVIHHLKPMVEAGNSIPIGLPEDIISTIIEKGGSVLTHIFGTFSSCACVIPANCVIAQLCRLVEGKAFLSLPGHYRSVSSGGTVRKGKKADLGELVGAVRGWRRREIEVENAKRWIGTDGFSVAFLRNRLVTRSEERESEGPQEVEGEGDDSMEVDKEETESIALTHQHSPIIPPSVIDDSASIPMDFDGDLENSTTPHQLSTTSSPRPKLRPVDSSSSLSSAGPGQSTNEDVDEGNESDATTVTVIRSHFSGSEDESEPEIEHDQDVQMEDLGKSRISGSEDDVPQSKGFRRVRRVLSPVAESRNVMVKVKDGIHLGKGKPKEKRIKQERLINSDKSVSGSLGKLGKPGGKGDKTKVVEENLSSSTSSAGKINSVRRGRKNRVVSSSVSEDDMMELDEGSRPPRSTSTATTSTSAGGTVPLPKAKASRVGVAKSRPHTPEASPLFIEGSTEVEETKPEVEAQVDTEPQVKETPPRPKDPTPPPKEPTPPPPKKVSFAEWMKLRKESQPIPASSGTVPPTVEGEPDTSDPAITVNALTPKADSEPITASPKSSKPVNLFEHLPTNRSDRVQQPTPVLSFPLSSGILPSTPGALPVESPKQFQTPSTSYTPRSGTTSSTGSSDTGLPVVGIEYYPIHRPSTTSYIPRPTTLGSYVPRQTSEYSTSTATGAVSGDPTSSAYVPRPSSVQNLTPSQTNNPIPPIPGFSLLTSQPQTQTQISAAVPTPQNTPTSLPPILQSRDLPPHQTPSTGTAGSGKLPPTGPKVPPTGPRSSWGNSSIPSGTAPTIPSVNGPSPTLNPVSRPGSGGEGAPTGPSRFQRGGYRGFSERGFYGTGRGLRGGFRGRGRGS